MASGHLLASGLLERIGESVSLIRHRAENAQGERVETQQDVEAPDHRAAFNVIAAILHHAFGFEAGDGPDAIGHRVVHGGEAFSASVAIDQTVIDTIRKLIPLAPLHNPANLTGIEACRDIFPLVPQVAVFDTAFHQTMPPHAFRYAIPEAWYSGHGIRRYGFHGSSHRYVANRAADHLQRPLEDLKVITLHLGNGASAAAIQYGRCIDTSMGFTPLEGLVMGTRCGDLDAAIPLYLEDVLGQSAGDLQEALNRESGLKGLCGSNDLREVLASEQGGDERARLALEVYCYRIRKYIGAYFVALDGLDALIFTGGIGENAALIRSRVCQGLEKLGIVIDREANDRSFEAIGEIGRCGHPVRVLVVRTNEELQIAGETLAVLTDSQIAGTRTIESRGVK